MTEYLTEQEQVEQLKNWIKQYGLTLLAGIIMAIILVTAWDYWQRYQQRVLIHASGIYEEMLTLRAQNNASDTIVQANKLLEHYPKTPYASMASFMLARDAIEKRNYPLAKEHLNWVIDHSHHGTMKDIATIRLARLAVAEKKPDEALQLLRNIDNKNFEALIQEVTGDAYLEKEDPLKAKAAYQLALIALPKEDMPRRPILQMKVDNLITPNDLV